MVVNHTLGSGSTETPQKGSETAFCSDEDERNTKRFQGFVQVNKGLLQPPSGNSTRVELSFFLGAPYENGKDTPILCSSGQGGVIFDPKISPEPNNSSGCAVHDHRFRRALCKTLYRIMNSEKKRNARNERKDLERRFNAPKRSNRIEGTHRLRCPARQLSDLQLATTKFKIGAKSLTPITDHRLQQREFSDSNAGRRQATIKITIKPTRTLG